MAGRDSKRARCLRMGLDTHVSLPLFTMLLLAAIWVATFHFIENERAASRLAAAESVLELVETYEAQAARSVNAIEQTLKLLKYAAERKGAHGALPELNAHGLLPSGLVFIVSVTDAQGMTVASNPRSAPVSVAGESYFEFHRQDRTATTYVARTMQGANKEWHMYFTRRLEDSDGRFAGIAVVEVDPAYFTSGYEHSRLGDKGMLGLAGPDGVIRSMRIGDKVSWGQPADQRMMANGGALMASPWDGVRRYTASRPLHGYKLSVFAGLAEDEQLAAFRKQRREHLREAALASGLLLLIAGMGWALAWQGAKARRRIRRAQETYAAASEANMDAFFVLRAIRNMDGAIIDFKFTAVNPRAQQLTGRSKQELMSQTFCNWLPAARHNGMFERMTRICIDGGVHQEEAQNLMPQFQADWLHWQVVGVEGGVVAIVRDISERMRYEARIVHMAHHDTLTGLPNRCLIVDRLQQAVMHAERQGRSVLVAFIDLDSFKIVNDTMGHSAGDELLRVVAERMVDCVRRNDTVGRFGGDEFVLVLPHVDQSPLALAPLLDKILGAVVEPIMLRGQTVQVSCSIGAAVYPRDGRDADTLMMHADMAMYRAKEGGKNNCQFYSGKTIAAA